MEAEAAITDPEVPPEKRLEAEAKAIQDALRLKRRRVLSSFLESIRGNTKIEVREWLL